jgi:hypothetical protein
LIAELLIDAAACRRRVGGEGEREALEALRRAVRQREQRCVEDLLRLHAFRPEDASAGDLPLLDGRWGDDLFNPETLRLLGLQLGGGAAAGAAAGAGIDLLTGGLTLGVATVIGALAGGGAQTARHYGSRLWGKLRGERELTVDDAVLRLLALRQQQLVRALEARGHAAADTLRVAIPEDADWRQGRLPEPLRKARAHPEWSSLNPGTRPDAGERQAQVARLAAWLGESATA